MGLFLTIECEIVCQENLKTSRGFRKMERLSRREMVGIT